MPTDRRRSDISGTRPATPRPADVDPQSGYRDPLPTEDREGITPAAPVRDRATLSMVVGPEPGRVFCVDGENTTFGRASHCTVRIDEPGVSRIHACVQREGREFFIIDQGSRNGTSIDGVRISSRQRVHDGARIGLGPSVSFRFAMADEAEERCQKLLYEASTIDPLTGASNRKHLYQRLSGEIAFARRHDQPLSLLIVDLDNLKKINDRVGHFGGDAALRSLSDLIRSALRTEDFVARYGGDEFVIVARGIGLPSAVAMAERLRKIVESTEVAVGNTTVSITVSIGVSSLSCARRGCTAEDLIKIADDLLYVAKRGGRNRVDFTHDVIEQVG